MCIDNLKKLNDVVITERRLLLWRDIIHLLHRFEGTVKMVSQGIRKKTFAQGRGQNNNMQMAYTAFQPSLNTPTLRYEASIDCVSFFSTPLLAARSGSATFSLVVILFWGPLVLLLSGLSGYVFTRPLRPSGLLRSFFYFFTSRDTFSLREIPIIFYTAQAH